MEKIILNDKEYELIKDYKNGYDKEEVASKFTDYFDNFDYVCGDWAYGKLRLKGFYDHKNKQVKEYNDYESVCHPNDCISAISYNDLIDSFKTYSFYENMDREKMCRTFRQRSLETEFGPESETYWDFEDFVEE